MSNRVNILSIQSSGQLQGSTTRSASAELINQLQAADHVQSIVTRDLAEGIPFVDQDWIGANFTPAEDRTAEQTARLAFSEGLIEELETSDLVIIGTPIYNFGVPAVLKAWIDQIARARRTFRYTPEGPVGLLENKTAVIVAASGGTAIGSDADFATGYLRHVLGFVGIHDVHVIAAERQMADADAAKTQLNQQMTELISTLTKG